MDRYWEGVWNNPDINEYATHIKGYIVANPEFLDVFKKYNVKSVCDAACGFGAYSAMLKAKGYRVSGFDVAKSSVDLTKMLLSASGYEAEDYFVCDICDTVFQDSSFDGVIAHAVLDHLPIQKAEVAIKELIRITKPKGLIYISFDPLEEKDLSEPHTVKEDGSYLYDGGSRNGLLFKYYEDEDVNSLLSSYRVIYKNKTSRGVREVIIQRE